MMYSKFLKSFENSQKPPHAQKSNPLHPSPPISNISPINATIAPQIDYPLRKASIPAWSRAALNSPTGCNVLRQVTKLPTHPVGKFNSPPASITAILFENTPAPISPSAPAIFQTSRLQKSPISRQRKKNS